MGPWGTPEVTGLQEEEWPPRMTLWKRTLKYSDSQAEMRRKVQV